MPGDGLALAVGVSRQVDAVGVLRGRLELAHDLLLLARYDVLRREAVLDVDAELGLREVAHVADGGVDVVVRAQETGQGARLRR